MKRYDFTPTIDGGFSMRESATGNWVTWGTCRDVVEENERLQAEVDHWTQRWMDEQDERLEVARKLREITGDLEIANLRIKAREEN